MVSGWGLGAPAAPQTSASLCRMRRYYSSSRDEAAANIPLLFVTSPSAKDPTWEMRYPGDAALLNLTRQGFLGQPPVLPRHTAGLCKRGL